MYITSELFATEPASANDSPSYSEWNTMPDWPENSLFPASLGKRKRNTDTDTENSSTTYSNSGNEASASYGFEAALNPRQNLLRTRSLPVSVASHNDIHIFRTTHLPSGPRALFPHDIPFVSTSSSLHLQPSSNLNPNSSSPPPSKLRRKILLPPRSSALKTTTANAHNLNPVSTATGTSKPSFSSSHDLRPCNVCHKAPTRTRDLEAYTSCEACGERACQICTRTCEGGCAKLVCSACCKEVGADGDPWCIDCVERRRNIAEDRMV